MAKEITYEDVKLLLRNKLNLKDDYKQYSNDLENIVLKLKTKLQEEKGKNKKLKEDLEKQIDLLAADLRRIEAELKESNKQLNKLIDMVQKGEIEEVKPFSLLEVD